MWRSSAVASGALFGLACATAPQGPAGATYRSSCMHMETGVFEGEYSASAIEGRTVVGAAGDFEGLPNVQVAVRSLSTQRVVFVVSDSTGRFALPRLEPGRYEVSTCLDGFDSVEFTARVAQTAKPGTFLLFLPASESGSGIIDVRYRVSER